MDRNQNRCVIFPNLFSTNLPRSPLFWCPLPLLMANAAVLGYIAFFAYADHTLDDCNCIDIDNRVKKPGCVFVLSQGVCGGPDADTCIPLFLTVCLYCRDPFHEAVWPVQAALALLIPLVYMPVYRS